MVAAECRKMAKKIGKSVIAVRNTARFRTKSFKTGRLAAFCGNLTFDRLGWLIARDLNHRDQTPD